MGVGGKFWDMLKPYARYEGFDYLREKRVAVDLSFWIVQQETALKANARNPHLRLTFFRTINLFSKLGAFPVFVVDGTPSPLKSQARIARFFRSSGLDISSLPVAKEGVSVERNRAFVKCVQECVELLELLGMPVLKAKGEAEALCAQLNNDGLVDACITSDSDAFLFGAKCVVKSIRPNSKEPFECYHMPDIEVGLGLKRNHLIAISLLVGNDHDLHGVQGIGLDTALQFVKKFSEEEILDRLCEIGQGITPIGQGLLKSLDDVEQSSEESLQKTRSSHCSFCGHPGNKRAHFKFSCEYCGSGIDGCIEKSAGFKCTCVLCEKSLEEKEQKKHGNWWTKVCNKITAEPSFPNNKIIELYLCGNNGNDTATDGNSISWGSPKTEMLVDFLAYHQLWEPSYIRQRMLPMLSTIYLREVARHPVKTLLYGQYDFHSIHRIKIRYGHQFFVVKWQKAAPMPSSVINTLPVEDCAKEQGDLIEVDEPVDMLDDSSDLQICLLDGCWFLLTDENMELVRSAFPDEVDKFCKKKQELEESKRRKNPSLRSAGSSKKSESPNSKGAQMNITEFYRTTKVQGQSKLGEDAIKNTDPGERTSNEKRKTSSSNFSKSARRRLLLE